MLRWFSKNWFPLAVGAAVGATGSVIYERHAAASASPALPGPASVQVGLHPGTVSVSASKSGSVLLTLPVGASWAGSKAISPLNPTAAQPSGSAAFNLAMSPTTVGIFQLTASWIDSGGTAQTTTVDIDVS